jgi:ankyrin repeat protein
MLAGTLERKRIDHQNLLLLSAGLEPNFDVTYIARMAQKVLSNNPGMTNSDDGFTQLLKLACARNLIQVNNVNANTMDEDNQETPLIKACASGDAFFVNLLLELGADLRKTDLKGHTALHAACANGHLEIVDILLDNRIFVDAFNSNFERAIHFAVKFPKIVERLLQASISFDCKDSTGCTPLHRVVSTTSPVESLQFLIDAGADITIVDKMERTPLQLAQADTSYLADEYCIVLRCAQALLDAKAEDAQSSAKMEALHTLLDTEDAGGTAPTLPPEMVVDIFDCVDRTDYYNLVQNQDYASRQANGVSANELASSKINSSSSLK